MALSPEQLASNVEDGVRYLHAYHDLSDLANIGMGFGLRYYGTHGNRMAQLESARILLKRAGSDIRAAVSGAECVQYASYNTRLVAQAFGIDIEAEDRDERLDKVKEELVNASANLLNMQAGRLTNARKEHATVRYIEYVGGTYNFLAGFHKVRADETIPTV